MRSSSMYLAALAVALEFADLNLPETAAIHLREATLMPSNRLGKP